MNNITKLKKLLLVMEKNNDYFYVHGGDILFTFFTAIIVWGVFSYISLKKTQRFYKKNWPKYRCDPAVTPFAGFLNPPPGSDFQAKMKYTLKNYAVCNLSILQSNAGIFTQPIKDFQKMLAFLMVIALSGLDFIRNMFVIIKGNFLKIIGYLYGKFANIMIELQIWMANLKDTFWKIAATLLNFMFFGVATFYTTMTFLNNLVSVIIIILIIVTIVALFFLAIISILPMIAIPGYIVWTVIYISIVVPLIIVAIFVGNINKTIEQQNCDADPNCCFHGDTKLKTERGVIQMKNIEIGDKLENSNVVHSIMKIKACEPLYNLNDVLVSGNHYFHCEKNGYIKVKDSSAKLSDIKTEYYYCLITSKKEIIINNIKFCDWDDLEKVDIMQIKNMFKLDKTEEINDMCNSCLHPDTNICITNIRENIRENIHTRKKIKNIKIGDKLCDGSYIIGIVKSKPFDMVKYTIDDKIIMGKNIYFSNLGDFIKIKQEIYKTNEDIIYYNVITNTGKLNVDNIEIEDHNNVFDTIIDKANIHFS